MIRGTGLTAPNAERRTPNAERSIPRKAGIFEQFDDAQDQQGRFR